jgi:hypothetical protein
MKFKVQPRARANIFVALATLAFLISNADGEVIVYPAPQGEVLSTNYIVEADGKPVAVYLAQTQHEDKRPYSFAYFDFSGTVTVKIKSSFPLDKLVVRPDKYGIKPAIDHGEATFTIDKHFNISLEPDGENSPLLLFSNVVENDAPNGGDTNVIYFGPGVHKPTRVDLMSGQTLYIAGGAVVKGAVISRGDNIRIMGRGILDGSDWPHSAGPAGRMIMPADGRNILIQDVIIRGSWNWTVAPTRCDQVLIRNIRICGSRCGNDDGIDPCNSRNVTIENCFLRTDDDAIAIKGTANFGQAPLPSENIAIRDCTFWVDFANGFRIGAESRATGCRNISAQNIEFIHFPNRDVVSIFYLHPEGNMPMENLSFENIRVNGELPLNLARLTPMDITTPRIDASTNSFRGTNEISSAAQNSSTNAPRRRFGRPLTVAGDGPYVHNVTFKNIEIYGEPLSSPPDSKGGRRSIDKPATGKVLLKGLSEKHDVCGVVFENINWQGQLLNSNSPNVLIDNFATDVKFRPAESSTKQQALHE